MALISDDSLIRIRSWKGFERFDGSDLNYKSKNEEVFQNHENTVLMEAVEKDDLNVVNELISSGADVNAVNLGTGQTPLLFIKEDTQNAVKITNALAKAGANINFIQKLYDDWINTPLISACMHGQLDLVQELINLGADVNLSNPQGWTAICQIDSSSEDYFSILKELISAGASLNAGNGIVLRTAIKHSNKETVAFLLRTGANADLQADDDDDGKTALMTVLAGDATSFSAEEAVELFSQIIDTTKDINKTDNSKRSALFYALDSHIGDKDAKRFITDKIFFRDELNANLIDKDGCNALNLFLSSAEPVVDYYGRKVLIDEDRDIICNLLISGCDAESRNKLGVSPAMIAKKMECDELNEMLEKKQEIINLENRKGQSPLLIASALGYTEKVKWLLKKGAYSNKKNKCHRKTIKFELDIRFNIPMGEEELKPKLITALMVAQNIETVRLLIKAGADVNAKTTDGYTALMYFAIDAWVEGLNEILSAGADPNLTNVWNETAWILACESAKRRKQSVKDEIDVIKILSECTTNKLIPSIVSSVFRLFKS